MRVWELTVQLISTNEPRTPATVEDALLSRVPKDANVRTHGFAQTVLFTIYDDLAAVLGTNATEILRDEAPEVVRAGRAGFV